MDRNTQLTRCTGSGGAGELSKSACNSPASISSSNSQVSRCVYFLVAGWTRGNLVGVIVVIGDKTVTNYLQGTARFQWTSQQRLCCRPERPNQSQSPAHHDEHRHDRHVAGARRTRTTRLAKGIGVGLLAACIGALYAVFARWGIALGDVSRAGSGFGGADGLASAGSCSSHLRNHRYAGGDGRTYSRCHSACRPLRACRQNLIHH